MDTQRRRLGVCSWSLRASGPGELARLVAGAGLDAVQLALEPLRTGAWGASETRSALADAGITILSGMMAMRGEDYSTIESISRTGGVRPDETWEDNRRAAAHVADIAASLGITLVTFHAGFIPHDRSDPVRGVMLERLDALAEVFASRGIAVGLETGQESGAALDAALEELGRDDVGVNFDPANMILYSSGSPIEALRLLAPRVRQVHAKDAIGSGVAGRWGREVEPGAGEVDWDQLFAVLGHAGVRADVAIERETGEDRAGDVRRAAAFLREWLPAGGAMQP